MIDNVYHNERQIEMTKRGRQREKVPSGGSLERFSETPAVRELLDHLAEELAKEYISLMKETAEKPGKREE